MAFSAPLGYSNGQRSFLGEMKGQDLRLAQ